MRKRRKVVDSDTSCIKQKKADLSVFGLHSIPAALGQAVLAVGRQRILLVAVVRLTQTSLHKDKKTQGPTQS